LDTNRHVDKAYNLKHQVSSDYDIYWQYTGFEVPDMILPDIILTQRHGPDSADVAHIFWYFIDNIGNIDTKNPSANNHDLKFHSFEVDLHYTI